MPKETAEEPLPKKPKTDSQEQGARDDWEAVEKPGEASFLERSTEMSEEGEKVERVELAESEGEEVEKPREKEEVGKSSASGYEIVDEGNRLGKDW